MIECDQPYAYELPQEKLRELYSRLATELICQATPGELLGVAPLPSRLDQPNEYWCSFAMNGVLQEIFFPKGSGMELVAAELYYAEPHCPDPDDPAYLLLGGVGIIYEGKYSDRAGFPAGTLPIHERTTIQLFQEYDTADQAIGNIPVVGVRSVEWLRDGGLVATLGDKEEDAWLPTHDERPLTADEDVLISRIITYLRTQPPIDQTHPL